MYYGYVWCENNKIAQSAYRLVILIEEEPVLFTYEGWGLVNQLIYKQIIEHVFKIRNNTIIIEKVIMIFVLSW